MRIALADDDRDIREQVSAIVRKAGHVVDDFTNGLDVQKALQRDTYDVVLLDWNMPGRTGFQILEWAADNLDSPPPFILLTSRQDKSDIVKGLEAGAVDYIVKPESEEVIRARIEAAARRTSVKETRGVVQYGPFEVNHASRTISRDGDAIALTAKEYDLAVLMFENIDKPLSRGYLFSRVWGGNIDVETRTIDMHVSRLRSKLGLTPESGLVIRTVFGFGYRMDHFEADALA
ncbi:response regulator transcription factor [Erythrobacter sp. SCSIO 43205]|uniref:response regulator transcription factor n=1 Tax=Erythrobacter sp. SCSIO 43205 TaxID=2779361 RepID=UPI001CA9E81F|nr:response regulator transcription factor [Erythrobacter sp. SCSIO 43205]UAB77657.1 response regulator transcription factor [Erythrobacter sp. SCSIO 43205]